MDGSYPRRRRVTTWAEMLERTRPGEGGCLLWIAATSGNGYGSVWFRGRVQIAHRVAYVLTRGELPDGQTLVLDHLCRVRACINPDHLELVTFAENVRRGEQTTKTYCVNGHERNEANTYVRKDKPGKQCRVCGREQQRNRRVSCQ